MTEKNRQLLLAYRDSLTIAYIIAACMMSFSLRLGLGKSLIMGAITGFLFGTSFFLLGTVRERVRVGSFALNVVLQTLLVTLTISVAGFLAMWTAMTIFSNVGPFHPDLLKSLFGLLEPRYLIPALIGGTFLAGMINGLFAIDRKLGPGVLRNWMTGKYYHPREEERIFMFLDMNDSTTLAESLGNLKFSALVKDFFCDLTYPLLETKGEVSHYIGDEAVLTWKVDSGVARANCVLVFFKFGEALESRRDYYLQAYGLMPEFKAGLHIGQVVATEVGEIKSEIVYHGDVLNTTARIQGLCHEAGHRLLLSEDLVQRLPEPVGFEYLSLGQKRLKGKVNEMEIFAVKRLVSSN